MKTLKSILIGTLMITSLSGSAQILKTMDEGFPTWGVPVQHQRYYYLPDIHTYYDIPSREYISLNNGTWVRSKALPVAHRNYNLKAGRKVVINDYQGNAPYTYYNVHRVKYVPAKRVHVKDKVHKSHPGRGHAKGHVIGKGHAKGKGKGHAKHNH